MSKMKPVYIVWRDAHACYPSWAEVDSIDPGEFTCETVGWKLPKSTKPGWTVIVLNRTQTGLVGDGIAIPDEMIVSCDVLMLPKSEAPK